MKAAALRGALSDRAQARQGACGGELLDGDTPQTKTALSALIALTGRGGARARGDHGWRQATRLSLRNVAGVHLIEDGQLNTRDVLVSDHVVFIQEALDGFVARGIGTVKQEDEQQ